MIDNSLERFVILICWLVILVVLGISAMNIYEFLVRMSPGITITNLIQSRPFPF